MQPRSSLSLFVSPHFFPRTSFLPTFYPPPYHPQLHISLMLRILTTEGFTSNVDLWRILDTIWFCRNTHSLVASLPFLYFKTFPCPFQILIVREEKLFLFSIPRPSFLFLFPTNFSPRASQSAGWWSEKNTQCDGAWLWMKSIYLSKYIFDKSEMLWDFPKKDHEDPPPQNVTKLFTGLLQPTLQEGTSSFVSGGPSVCDETQNLNDTDSETFFCTKFFETGSEIFLVPIFFWDRFR